MSDLGISEIGRFNATSSQPNVLVGSLRLYRVPLPSTKTEQTAIVDQVGGFSSFWFGATQEVQQDFCRFHPFRGAVSVHDGFITS